MDSFDQITGYDLIINCTGLNAHSVLKDKDLHPIRGQVNLIFQSLKVAL